MLNNLLKVSPELQAQGYPKYPGIGEASLYALLGFVVVFLGIAFLIFIVWAVGKLMATFDKKMESKKNTPKNKQTTETPATPNAATEEEISEETVAAITAALMAYYVQENKKCEFTIKRIKRM